MVIRLALAGAGICALPGCRDRERPSVIAIAWPGHRAARFAAAEVESVSGGRIRIAWDSVGTDPAMSHQAAQVDQAARIVSNERVVGVVGHRGSRESLLMAPIFSEAHVPWILSGATSRRLRSAGPWTFTLAPDDSVEGEYIGRFVADRIKARSVTIFYIVDEYGVGLRDGITAALHGRNVRILDAVPVPDVARCDSAPYRSGIDVALRRGRPGLTILAARQVESGCIIQRIRARYPDMAFVMGDGVFADSTFLAHAAGTDSLFVAGFWHADLPDSLSRDFVARFRAATGETPRADDALIYDAFRTLAAAIDSGGAGRAGVRDWLASLGHGHAPFPGVTGPVAFPAQPDRMIMTRLVGGHLRLEAR